MCTFCVVVNNTVYHLIVLNNKIDILLNREGVRVILDCTPLINRHPVAETCKWWWQRWRPIGDAPNVILSNNDRQCIITGTISGQGGNDGVYTAGVCYSGGCYHVMNTVVVCGKNSF